MLRTLQLSVQKQQRRIAANFQCKYPLIHNLTFAHSIREFRLYPQTQAIYKDAENLYIHSMLRGVPRIDDKFTVPKIINERISSLEKFNQLLDQHFRQRSATEIVQTFWHALQFSIENNINLSDTRFNKLIDGLLDHVEDLTDGELSELLFMLEKYPRCDGYDAPNFHDMWSALDDVCCWRVAKWDTDQRFQFAEHWYRLGLGKRSDYTIEMLKKFSNHPDRLEREELIKVFFFMNVCRKQNVEYNFEDALLPFMPHLSVDEWAVVALGYFKSKSHIRNKLILRYMCETLRNEATTAQDIALTAILKMLRFSAHVPLADQLIALLDRLTPEMGRLSIVSCLHVALLGTTTGIMHEPSLQRAAERIVAVIGDLDQVRLKDMERIMIPLTMFDYDPKTTPNIFDAIMHELHRPERERELVVYPRCLSAALNYLSMRNLYSYQLAGRVLNPDWLTEIYGKNPRGLAREIVSLDTCLKLECPDYKGPRLDPIFKSKATKWMIEFTPRRDQYKKLSKSDLFVLDVIETVANVVGGENFLTAQHLLPQYSKADIVLCQNSQEQFLTPVGFDKYQLGDVKWPTNPDLKWFAVVTVGWNNTVRNDTETKQLGIVNMKCRQLKLLGYKPVPVIWSEFSQLTTAQKEEAIRTRLV